MLAITVAVLFFVGLVVAIGIATVALRRSELRDQRHQLSDEDDSGFLTGVVAGVAANTLADLAMGALFSTGDQGSTESPSEGASLDELGNQSFDDSGLGSDFDGFDSGTSDFVDFGGSD